MGRRGETGRSCAREEWLTGLQDGSTPIVQTGISMIPIAHLASS